MTAVLALLGRVPVLVWPLLAALIWGWSGHDKARSVAAEWAQARATQAEDARLANTSARAEETRRRREQLEAADAHTKTLERLRADAAAAGSAVERLRAQLARNTARGAAAGDRPVTGECPAGAAPAQLADVLGRCAERYRDVAAAADTARAAGVACERSYDALRPSP